MPLTDIFITGTSRVFRETAKVIDIIGKSLQSKPIHEQLQEPVRIINLTKNNPNIQANFIAPTASVIGNVNIGKNSSIWYGAVVRGDMKPITIGTNTIIGDRVMLHVSGGDPGYSLTIGNGVVVKPGAIVHGCTVEDNCVIGEGAQVLDGAIIQKNAKIAPGAIVMKGKVVGTGQLWSGVPAKYERDLTTEEKDQVSKIVKENIELANTYIAEISKSWREIFDDEENFYDDLNRLSDIPQRITLDQISKAQREVQYHKLPGRLFNSKIQANIKEEDF